MDELAKIIGCMPPSENELKAVDAELAHKVHRGPVTPYQYRLTGPGAWSGARAAVLEAESRTVYALSGGRISSLPKSML